MGSPPRKGDTWEEREKGREGKRERGTIRGRGGVYMWSICLHLHAHGSRRRLTRPPPGWISPPLRCASIFQFVQYIFTIGWNQLCADSSQKGGTPKVSRSTCGFTALQMKKAFPRNSHVPPTLGAPRSSQSAPGSISLT